MPPPASSNRGQALVELRPEAKESTPRRLVPQRAKKKKASYDEEPPLPSIPIAVAASGGGRGSGTLEDFEDEVRPVDNGDATNQITNAVADWASKLRVEKDSRLIRMAAISDEEAGEEEEEEEEEEKEEEYHGELESTSSANQQENTDDNENEEEGEAENYFNIVTEQEVSLNPPPPTYPLVLVDLGALCGCPPEEERERLMVISQLTEALLGSPPREDEGDMVGSGENDDEKMLEEGDQQTKKADGGDGSSIAHNNLLGDGFSLDYDERVVELFKTGIASHVDCSHPIAVACLAVKTEEDEETEKGKIRTSVIPYAIVPYPEFLSPQKQSSITATTTTRSTLRMWKLLHTLPIKQHLDSNDSASNDHLRMLQRQYSPLLHRVFTHLRNTSRSLLWKADMHHQLSLLVKYEHHAKVQRAQKSEYDVWKYTVRRERLEKLYDVRETFTLQLEVAQKKHEVLTKEREKKMERELRKRGLLELRNEWRRKQGKALVVGSNNISKEEEYEEENNGYVEDDGWGDAIIREEDFLSRYDVTAPTEEEDDEDEKDEWSPLETSNTTDPLGMKIVVDGIKTYLGTESHDTPNKCEERPPKKNSRTATTSITAINKLEPISHLDNLQHTSKSQQRQQQLASSTSAPRPSTDSATTKHQEVTQHHLQQQEESISDMLKTDKERIAHATCLKLQERLLKVDDLLEILQEEEWTCEEEEEEEDSARRANNATTENSYPEDTTFLDQILAMILGGLPPKETSGSISFATKREQAEEEEHYKYIMEEHKSMVNEWKEVFGRLPSMTHEESPPEAVEPVKEPLLLDGRNNGVSMPMPIFGGDEGLSSLPPSPQLNKPAVSGSSCKIKENQAILTGNNGSNWDEVENWDALMP